MANENKNAIRKHLVGTVNPSIEVESFFCLSKDVKEGNILRVQGHLELIVSDNIRYTACGSYKVLLTINRGEDGIIREFFYQEVVGFKSLYKEIPNLFERTQSATYSNKKISDSYNQYKKYNKLWKKGGLSRWNQNNSQ